jgi:putative glycosyltransferase
MDLSIVATLYRSAAFLPEFHRRVTAAAERLGLAFEVVYVNDGSPDESQAVAEAVCDADPRARVIELSRNFGHHKAMLTGLAEARGALVFLIDCDLEESPEWLEEFDRHRRSSGADVVYGVQKRRKGGPLERWTGDLFYKGWTFLSDCRMPRNMVTARLMTRAYVRALVAHEDREVCLAGLWTITGFRQVPLTVHKLSRGGSTYNLRRKLAVLINAVTSFSTVPLWGIFLLGCLILGASSAVAAVLVALRLFGHVLDGWTSVMLSIWLLGGLCLFSLGTIGVYLAKVFSEVKRRPFTVVRSVYGREEATGRNERPLRAG